ncbi:MAG: inositol monophosphatase family protein [Candidatus Bathyarchaeia archaeon]
MASDADWLRILMQCRENVKAHVQPLLRSLKEPQPDLGRGAGGDRMKLVDVAAEKAIVEVFLQHGFSFTLVSEESGVKEFGGSAGELIVTTDPIDGTTNLTRGLPFYCCSVAVSQRHMVGDVFAGMVADLFHGVTYTATLGGGAFRDDVRISPSLTAELDDAVIGLDLNTFQIADLAPRLTRLISRAKHIRHFGANALELCYVAEGLTDAFVDMRDKLRATDVAASFLILREAGGVVTAPDGQPLVARLSPQQKLRFVASGNPRIHKLILSLVKPE